MMITQAQSQQQEQGQEQEEQEEQDETEDSFDWASRVNVLGLVGFDWV